MLSAHQTSLWAGAVFCFTLLGWAIPAGAVTPESPEVKAVVGKALAYLNGPAGVDDRLGGKCLIGMAFLKNGSPPTHPKIVEALRACEEFAKSPTGNNATSAAAVDNYSVGLAVIFLCELDPLQEKHRASTTRIVNQLLSRQISSGGWTYDQTQNGDTSQTQYAALGLWMADLVGISVPQQNVEKLCGWLMRTQDPSGGWGYHGNDPGSMSRVAQNEVRPSLVAAGLGSVYICADLLGIVDPKEKRTGSDLPPVLQEVQEKTGKKKRGAPISRVIDAGALRRSMADGNQWFDRNFTVKTEQWNLYYLYGYERYMSFRELAEGGSEAEPAWYNQIFDYLQRTQQSDGSWTAPGDNNVTNTCFAVLCLLRSTKKIIVQKLKALGDGVMLAGMGLPKDISAITEHNGTLKEAPLTGSVAEILAIIEDPNNPELARLAESGASISLDSDVTKRSGQITQLRALVSAGAYESRIVAVRTLSKVRDLDNVPMLLFALSDPDVRVVRQADQGLRFISRKFRGIGLPLVLAPPNNNEEIPAGEWPEVKAAQKAWKQWYLSIRPDAELLE